MSTDLFTQLRTEAAALNMQLMPALQRVRTLMKACQVTNLPVNGRQFAWQPSGLLITGSHVEGMLVVLDHPNPVDGVRVCRGCGCTDLAACMTADGPCCWRVHYTDGTGLCSRCDEHGPQPSLFPAQVNRHDGL